MKLPLIRLALVLAVLVVSAAPTFAQLPKRDVTIELRQVDDGLESGTASYRAGPSATKPLVPQSIQVRNGEKAVLRINRSTPMQWVQSVQAASTQSGAGVTQQLVWLHAGQTITVQPRWPGGGKAALVEMEVQQASLEDRSQGGLPAQSRSQISTVVTAPLAQWVTVAQSGDVNMEQGRYSSETATGRRQLLQIRVMVP